jgi:hypothetical protein
MEEFMIFLAKRILREETDADKQEFVRGAVGLSNNGGKKALATGVATYMLANWLKRGK